MGRVHREEGEQERRPVQDAEADRLALVDDRERRPEGIGVRLGQRHRGASGVHELMLGGGEDGDGPAQVGGVLVEHDELDGR